MSVTSSRVQHLAFLAQKLQSARTLAERLEVLNGLPDVREFFEKSHLLSTFLSDLSSESELVIKEVVALGQGENVFAAISEMPHAMVRLRELTWQLLQVESFYKEVGGIVGYHYLTFSLLASQGKEIEETPTYHAPEGIDISQETQEVHAAILAGIEKLPLLAEMYPVGGAADRLRLQDLKTGLELPAAKLLFLGKTLLEGLIIDLQAREYLYYKLFRKQLTTPLALMTSVEKDNHQQILSICEENRWFGRSKQTFYFFSQPSVPTMNKEGNWCLQAPLQLLLKPGGHGVIWKLARDKGVFKWFCDQDRKKVLLRQINNPIAGTDYSLLAFAGIGCQEDKLFGFASCPRQIKAMEGMNVLIEKKEADGYQYVLTNIEYCDFKKCQIVDEPAAPESHYSKFPSNTNILFADLAGIEEAVKQCPIPGMLVNEKTLSYRTKDGELKEEALVRLESTMQNIADVFVEATKSPLLEGKRNHLKTFLTHHTRCKTISTIKREYIPGASLLETPEGCFLDFLKNAKELLSKKCKMQVPELSDDLKLQPSFLFFYHPSLGPLYSIIAQKVRGGKMAPGSELELDLAEANIENLSLDGSLRILATDPTGHRSESGQIIYSEKGGKCTLKNVIVHNQGIDRNASNTFWKKEIVRKACCCIHIQENGEFIAEDITLEGDLLIEIEPFTRVTARRTEEGKIQFLKEAITAPTWSWNYSIQKDHTIQLNEG